MSDRFLTLFNMGSRRFVHELDQIYNVWYSWMHTLNIKVNSSEKEPADSFCLKSWERNDLREVITEPPDSWLSNVFTVFTPQQTCSPQFHSYRLSTGSAARHRSSQMGSRDKDFCKTGLQSWHEKTGSHEFTVLLAELQTGFSS